MVSSEGAESRHLLEKVETELSGTMVMFSILTGALVTQANAFVKTWSVQLKRVHIIICKFSSKEKNHADTKLNDVHADVFRRKFTVVCNLL